MAAAAFPIFPGAKFPKRSPVWSTQKLPSAGGMESRKPLWAAPRWRYEIPFEVLRQDVTPAELDALMGLFNQMNGSAGVFTYVDPDDCAVINQQFGTGDGATTQFQLVRTLGGFDEAVYLPDSTLQVFVNGSPAALDAIGIGLVTFTSAPAESAVLTWTGTFSWPCQFDADEIPFAKIYDLKWAAQSVKFTTVNASKIPLLIDLTAGIGDFAIGGSAIG